MDFPFFPECFFEFAKISYQIIFLVDVLQNFIGIPGEFQIVAGGH